MSKSLYAMTEMVTQLYEMATNNEIDEQTFKNTIEAMCIPDKIDSYCDVLNQLKKYEIDIKEEIGRLKERKDSFEKAQERMKSALDMFLQAEGKTKEKTAKYTVYYTHNKAVDVFDENKVPDEYKIPQLPKIDKKTIKSVLVDGGKVKGCTLKESKSVVYR